MKNQTDWKVFLKRRLEHRQKKNSNYSIRAFARDLGIPQSTLSQLIHGKRRMTTETAFRICLVLKLDAESTVAMLKQTLSDNYLFRPGVSQK